MTTRPRELLSPEAVLFRIPLSPHPRIPANSPDADSLIGRQVHLVTRLHVEGALEGVVVRDGDVGAVLARRVWIAEKKLADDGLARVLAPRLRVAHEEALVAGEAVDHRRFLPLERDAIRAIRLREAAQITDVLAHRQLAVDVQPFHGREHVELRTEARRAL